MRNFLVFTFICVFTFNSCKKEEESPAQLDIIVDFPFEKYGFQSLDTVLVQGRVTATKAIDLINISVTTQSGSKVVPSVSLFPNQSDVTLNEQLVLSDIHLATGNYWLVVEARVGDVNGKVFRTLAISEAPRLREAVFFAANDGGNTNLYKLNEENQIESFTTVPGDFDSFGMNSFDQQLSMSGILSGNLRSLKLSSAQSVWELQNKTVGTNPYFDAVGFNDRNVFYATNVGELGGFDASGVGIFDAELAPGRRARYIYGDDEYVLTMEENLSPINPELVVRYTISGVSRHQLVLNEPLKEIRSLNTGRYLLIQNAPAGALLSVYDVEGNFIEFQKKTLAGQEVNEVARVGERQFLLLTNNSTVYLFDEVSFNETRLFNTTATQLAFDQVNDQIWTADGNDLNVFAYPQGVELFTISHSEEVKDLAIAFNK